MTMNTSKNSGGEKVHNIEHVLHPEEFIRLFTKERCTNEEKRIQKILQCIYALRNSGGGKLTIWLTERCSRSQIEECVKIIRKAVDDVLSESKGTDFLDWESRNRLLTFSIKGSEEIVTMKYNMYVMENNVAKLVPSTKSAAEVRLLLQRRKREPAAEYKTNIVRLETSKLETYITPVDQDIEYSMPNNLHTWDRSSTGFYGGTSEYDTTQHTLVSSKSPISRFVKDAEVQNPFEEIFPEAIRFGSLENTSTTEKSVASLLLQPENKLQQHVRYLAQHHGGHVYYGISSDGIVHGINVSKGERKKVLKVKKKIMHTIKLCPSNVKVYLKAVKNRSRERIPNLFVIGIYVPFHSSVTQRSGFFPRFTCSPYAHFATSQITAGTETQTEVHEEFFEGEVIKPSRSDMVVFKLLDKKFRNSRVGDCITLEQNELLKNVSALANHQGGELYYGICSDGTVCGERLDEIERDYIRREVKKKIANMVFPKVDGFCEFYKISFLPVSNHDDAHQSFVIKISINRCPGGVFVENPESYYVLGNCVVKLPFSKWIARIQDAAVKITDKTASNEPTGKINYVQYPGETMTILKYCPAFHL